MSGLVASRGTQDDTGITTWELRRGPQLLGTLHTTTRRGGPVLTRVDVSPAHAPAAFAALVDALRGEGASSLAIDLAAGDDVTAAAIVGTAAREATAQMELRLDAAVAAPARVTKRPMTDEEFSAYREQLVAAYAQDLFDAGGFPDLAAALAGAEASTRQLLPDGVRTPGHYLWTAEHAEVPVGTLWLHADDTRAFIYDIEVRPEQQRRGYGRELLAHAARSAAELGAQVLGLNVFATNQTARKLYESAGYATTLRTYRIAI